MNRNIGSQTGFTLLEVLIAVTILSLGLLGLGAMQAASLRYNQHAHLRSQATMIASDIIARMRTNQAGVAAGNYDAVDTRNGAPDDQNCDTSLCSPAQIANQDIREWANHFFDVYNLGSQYSPALPANAYGTVTKNAGVFTVSINWTEVQAMNNSVDSDNPTKSFSIDVVL
ncbi:MAG TPA: type IV pilus modification protein PilV [Sedimenticola sp.]|nr:type IV pilus modification protein PilV [Sedimenticola sp.]